VIQQVTHFKYLGCDITYESRLDVDDKLYTFQATCECINRIIEEEISKVCINGYFIILWQYHN